ncbi:hypothetical protein X961_4817 [Burkholderia pseudomallei MSHR5613]|nr:hypothetical protein X961_4817 [Burkholderia pseudomallei MSHR5613]
MRTVQLLPTYSVDKTSVTIRPGMCSDRTHQTRHRTDRAAAEHHDRQCTQHHRQLSHFFRFRLFSVYAYRSRYRLIPYCL